MNSDDLLALRQQIPEAGVIAPRHQLGVYRGGNNVTRGTKAGAFSVMGDVPGIQAIKHVPLTGGRFIHRLDVQEKRKVAVIGSRVVDLLFEEEENPIGENIRINGVYFKVVGTFKSSNPGNERDQDASTIHIPFTTFRTAFNYGNTVGWFAITSRADVPASVAEEKVLALLARRHHVSPDDRRAFGHFNLEKEYEQVQGLFGGIRALIWIVGIGTLAAGVIGVSNIMLVIVKERTHEIGARRAVGATPLSIMTQLLLEALFLTGIAGYLGMMAGVGVMEAVNSLLISSGTNAQMFRNPNVSLVNAIQSLVILVAAGGLAGLIPARRAVAVRPVEALRAE
jgi:putative ABC transport system permease protein